jgi:F420-dependent oxidoreductase-like protein
MRTLKFGVNIPMTFRDDYSKLESIAQTCDSVGFDSFWLPDHFFFSPHCNSYLEAWTAQTALAAITKRLRFGNIVLCNSYRHPSVLAKMATTFDAITGGRLEFGIGAGWKEDECIAYGIPFPRASVRIGQLREAVIIIKKMWTEESPNYEGRYYTIRNAICEPKPVQKPHPPILIGGSGEKLLLKVVAELADRCNFDFGIKDGIEAYKHKIDVLNRHCLMLGRDPSEIEKAMIKEVIVAEEEGDLEAKIQRFKPTDIKKEDYIKNSIVGTPEDCIKRIHEYADLGFTYFIVNFPDMTERKTLRLFAEKIISKLK